MANRINIDLYNIHFELARFIHFFPDEKLNKRNAVHCNAQKLRTERYYGR